MRTGMRVLRRNKEGTYWESVDKGEHRAPGQSRPVDDRPYSVYEVVTRRMLEEMKEDMSEIKGRVNALLWMVAGAVLLEVVMKLVG